MRWCDSDCEYLRFDKSTGMGDCVHPDDYGNGCPGYIKDKDARNEAKYGHLDKY